MSDKEKYNEYMTKKLEKSPLKIFLSGLKKPKLETLIDSYQAKLKKIA